MRRKITCAATIPMTFAAHSAFSNGRPISRPKPVSKIRPPFSGGIGARLMMAWPRQSASQQVSQAPGARSRAATRVTIHEIGPPHPSIDRNVTRHPGKFALPSATNDLAEAADADRVSYGSQEFYT